MFNKYLVVVVLVAQFYISLKLARAEENCDNSTSEKVLKECGLRIVRLPKEKCEKVGVVVGKGKCAVMPDDKDGASSGK